MLNFIIAYVFVSDQRNRLIGLYLKCKGAAINQVDVPKYGDVCYALSCLFLLHLLTLLL